MAQSNKNWSEYQHHSQSILHLLLLLFLELVARKNFPIVNTKVNPEIFIHLQFMFLFWEIGSGSVYIWSDYQHYNRNPQLDSGASGSRNEYQFWLSTLQSIQRGVLSELVAQSHMNWLSTLQSIRIFFMLCTFGASGSVKQFELIVNTIVNPTHI